MKGLDSGVWARFRKAVADHGAPLLLALGVLTVVPACGTQNSKQLVAEREAAIMGEPLGDFYIGRRYYTQGARFWGFLRRPRESWESSKLVIFNEKLKHQPDRVPEAPLSGRRHGYDHNWEYRIFGYFSGDEVYDPNSNYILPEFVLKDYELVSKRERSGFLFDPAEKYHPKRLPPRR